MQLSEMMPSRIDLSFAAIAIVAAGLLVSPCVASDPLGAAGPIRSFGGKACNMDFTAIQKGECDPPPVDPALAPERRSQERLERARQLLTVPRIEQAIQELDAAVADNPLNRSALLLRARLKIEVKPGEAFENINEAIRIDPENSNALATRAFLLQGKDERGSLRDATQAIALDPKNADALWIRARILRRMNSLDEAERDLSSAILVEPDDARALLLRAQIRMQMGKPGEAKADATAVLALRRSDRDALQLRAVAQAMTGDYAGALNDLNATLGPPEDRARPSAPLVGSGVVNLYVQRALALTRLGKPAEARRDLDTIVALGGIRAILQMQMFLRSHGFPDVALDGKRSDQLDDALQSCFINDACGRGMTLSG